MRRPYISLLFLVISILVQLGCQTPDEQVPVQPVPQIEATNIVEIATLTATPAINETGKDLIICLPEEPETLFWYSQQSEAEKAVLDGIFENDITTPSYDYQAVGLELIPSFQNGDASIRVVPVKEDDLVVDAEGNVVSLQPGNRIIDSEGNLITFDGAKLFLNQWVVDFKMKQRNWSDGQPVTAADSVYSFHLAAHADSPGDKYLTERTASYQSMGNLQIRWTGLPGFQPTDFQLNFHHPLPRHTWLDLELQQLETAQASSILPVGDGPFQIVEWRPGESIRLEPNPFYYRSPAGYPRLESVTYRFIADTNQRISQLLKGNCHVLSHQDLAPDLIPFFLQAEEEGMLQTSINPDNWGWEIIFGINSWDDYGDGIGRPDWFEDARVRQAFSMCIDKQDLVDTLYQGQSAVADNYIPSNHPLLANDIASWPYDPNTANTILDEIGFIDTDLDGIREDPQTGSDFRVSLVIGLEPGEHASAQMIEANLMACGIEILIERQSPDDQTEAPVGDKVNGRRFDLALSSFEVTQIPDCTRFTSGQISGPPDQTNPITEDLYDGWEGKNRSGWSNQTFDAICASALNSLSGSPEQRLNHQQAQRIFSTELPVLPLVYNPKITVMRPNVQNVANDPSQDSEFWNLYEISLEDEPIQ